jgi:aldehyde:ferredoxin oxidoreductase
VKGFYNRLLRVDLSTGSSKYEQIPDTVFERSLGGKGLGSHYLLDENPRGVHPLDPQNRFIITVGPVTGTRMWSQSRFAVFTKSPATGGYGESYCGGSLAPKIKACGVDAIVLEGACRSLSTLLITDEGVQFHDAAEHAGRETFDAESHILENSPKGAGAMVIGPAGEHGVVFACIKSDRWRSLGRGGMGAVLGSKKLKGIAFAGDRKAEIADEDLVREVIRNISKKGKGSPITDVYQDYGTISQVRVTNSQNCFPTRYWQSGHFEKWENLSADYMREHFEVKRHGCPNCFLQCTKKAVVREGRHRGLEIEGPEYETVYAIGGLNCIESLEEVAYLNDLCDRLGLDTMSAGNMAGFVTEAYKRGKIDFAIDYNQPDRIAELLQLIGHAQGIGKLLGSGIKQVASELDLDDLAVHVKGLEPAGFDPRVLKGMGLSYATAARGACHLRGTFYKAELSGEIPKEQIQGKAELHIDCEDRAVLFDSLILCRFFRDFIKWDELSELIAAATGMRLGKQELRSIANQTTERTRLYNAREGIDPSLDTLPPYLLDNPTQEGVSISREELRALIYEYNQIRRNRYEKAKTAS